MYVVDALYAVLNITGRDGSWPVTQSNLGSGDNEACEVHADEMVRGLQEIFQLDEEAMDELKKEALQRKVMECAS